MHCISSRPDGPESHALPQKPPFQATPPRAGLGPGGLAVLLVAQMALGLFAMTISLPSMPEWAAEFGAQASSVQLTFSGYVLTYGALQLVYGPLSDRLGRRKMLLIGVGITVLASVACALAPNLPALIAGRVLLGAGTAAGMVVGRAAVQDLFDGQARTRVMAYVGMAMGVCPPLATVIGGQLHERFGWQASFWLLAVLAAGLWWTARAWLPHPALKPAPERHWVHDITDAFARLAQERPFVLLVLVLALTQASFYAFLAGTPTVLKHWGVGPGQTGFYMMVGPLSYILGNFLTSRLIGRLGGRMLMHLGMGCSVLSVLGMGGLGWAFDSPVAFAVPLLLLGIGHGLLIPPSLTMTVGIVPALAGSAAAIAGVAQQFTGAAGSYAVGFIDLRGPVQLAMLMMLFTLLAWGVLACLPRRGA